MEIYTDERVEPIDQKALKVTICCVEVDDTDIHKELDPLKESIINDEIRFPREGNKLHFSKLNDPQQSEIVEELCKMPVSVKVYTYYLIGYTEKEAKIKAMTETVSHIQWLHRSKEVVIFIEYAAEYEGTDLKKLLIKDDFAFILPDAFMSVYCKFLNEMTSTQTSSNVRFYRLMKSKIRLQSHISYKYEERNSREKRL